jgi:phosphatidylinositol kinase/protein kinase (PI-3  family)
MMFYSGFPCFKVHSLIKFEERFKLEMNAIECANHMRSLIENAHNKWTTNIYDHIQYLQNKIAY